MTRRTTPSPARNEPLLPAGMTLTLLVGSTMIAGILGGAAVSTMLCGHRPALAGPAAVVTVLGRLIRHPGDPAAAWPQDPHPGPAWLFWPCTVLAAIVWSATVLIIATLVDDRLARRRRHEGLGAAADLRRTGLDARSAVRKAAREYPDLVARHRTRRYHRRRR